MRSAGAAVLGDGVYGPKRVNDAAPRLALHAHRLAFTHPVSGAEIDVRTAFPKDLRPVLTRLDLPRPDLDERPDQLGRDPVGEEEPDLGG